MLARDRLEPVLGLRGRVHRGAPPAIAWNGPAGTQTRRTPGPSSGRASGARADLENCWPFRHEFGRDRHPRGKTPVPIATVRDERHSPLDGPTSFGRLLRHAVVSIYYAGV